MGRLGAVTRGSSESAHAPDGRQTRWEEHKAARRQQILDAAVCIIDREPPGTEFHVREIAEECGIGRPVVYRHFGDRDELYRAVRGHVLAQVRELLVPQVRLDGSIREIIERIVSTYVEWAAAHPALHRFAEREVAPSGDGDQDFEETIKALVDEVVTIIVLAAAVVGVELSDDDRASLEPLIFGVVGMAFATVRTWLGRGVRDPTAAALAGMLAQTIWWAIWGLAHDRGVDLDPDVPLEDMIASVVAELVD